MMKNKIKTSIRIRILLIIMTFCLLLSSVSCTKESDSSFLSITDFNDISYSKPDYDLFLEYFDYIYENRDSIFSSFEINTKYIKMVDIYDKIIFYTDYLEIREAFKYNDTYVLEQLLYLRKIYDDAYDKILIVSKYIRERKGGLVYRILYGKKSRAYDFPNCNGYYIEDSSGESSNAEKIATYIYNLDTIIYEDTTVPGDGYEYDYLVPPGLKNFDDSGKWIITISEINNFYKLGFICENTYKEMVYDLYNAKFASYGDSLKSLYSTYREYSLDKLYDSFELMQNESNGTSYTADYVINLAKSEISNISDLKTKLNENISEEFLPTINEAISSAFSDEDEFKDFLKSFFDRIDTNLVKTYENMINSENCNIFYDDFKKDIAFVSVISLSDLPFLFFNPGENPTICDFTEFLYQFGIYNYLVNSKNIQESYKDKEALNKAGCNMVLSTLDYLGLVFTESEVAVTARNEMLLYLVDKCLQSFVNTDFENYLATNKKLKIDEIASYYNFCLTSLGLSGEIVFGENCLDFIKSENTYKKPLSEYEVGITILNTLKDYLA